MNTLPAAQAKHAAFVAALLDPEHAGPAGLVTWNGSDPAARLAVYRNNVISSLVDALADNCPVVQALVGEDFFRAMAAVYVRRSPPRSPVLATYGETFADFIADFEPARTLPYLADVARLETLRLRAMHAADAAPLTAEAAQTALSASGDSNAVAELRLRWHPSVTLLRSAHAAVSLWAAHQVDGEPDLSGIDMGQPESALVLRPALEVLVLPLSAGAAAFVAATLEGGGIAEAAAAAQQAHPIFDVAGELSRLLWQGALAAIDSADTTRRP